MSDFRLPQNDGPIDPSAGRGGKDNPDTTTALGVGTRRFSGLLDIQGAFPYRWAGRGGGMLCFGGSGRTRAAGMRHWMLGPRGSGQRKNIARAQFLLRRAGRRAR